MYTLLLNGLEFTGERTEFLFDGYEFYATTRGITVRCPEESLIYIRNALQLALARYEIDGKCDDEIQSIIWGKSRVLFKYYSGEVEKKVIADKKIDEESLAMIEPWYKFLKVKPNTIVDFWNFALQEYYSSCIIETLEQSILNLITALEALFSVSSSELVYRVSLSTAMFLGDSSESRKEIFKLVKEMYDIRSKMVHGDVKALEKKLNSESIEKKYYQLKQIVSNSLYKTIGKSKDSLREEIETKIFL